MKVETQEAGTDHKAYKINQLCEMFGGIHRSTIYKWIKNKGFPKPVKIGPRCSLWPCNQVNDWWEQQLSPG